MKKVIIVSLLAGSLSLAVAAPAKAGICAGCHGANGENKALGVSKKLNEMSIEEFKTAIKGYKDGSYGGAMKGVMFGQASSISDTELDELAKHFSKK